MYKIKAQLFQNIYNNVIRSYLLYSMDLKMSLVNVAKHAMYIIDSFVKHVMFAHFVSKRINKMKKVCSTF